MGEFGDQILGDKHAAPLEKRNGLRQFGGWVPETEAARSVIIRTALETCTHLYGETQNN